MPPQLRVFVSSTMRDLANERDAVCRRLEEFNLVPVNAEAIPPSGEGPWQRLHSELEWCDLFVLVLGERYGWIPQNGPYAAAGKSVTELEFDEACRLGLPILPFFKRLGSVDHTTEDGRRVQEFRERVADWASGRFRGEFDLARDLADDVGRAIVAFLSDAYQRELMQKRHAAEEAESVHEEATATATRAQASPIRPPSISLPTELVDAVGDRSAVLLLGAGASLQAGLPSAALFVEAMKDRIRDQDPSYQPPSSGNVVGAIATDLVSVAGQTALHDFATDLVDPVNARPTTAHLAANVLFDTIVTTNYDLLIERALQQVGDRRPVIAADMPSTELPSQVVVKLHGSAGEPSTLLLTETEVLGLATTKPNVHGALVEELRRRPLLAVGTSLRDPSVVALLAQCEHDLRGWVALPHITNAERRRFQHWGLDSLAASADDIFEALISVRRR